MKINDRIGKQQSLNTKAINVLYIDRVDDNTYYNNLYGNALHQNSSPGGHESYSFGRLFFGNHYYILSLSDLCLGVEKMILIGIMHFHYMTYMAIP